MTTREPFYWLNNDSRHFLAGGYLLDDVTPEARYRYIADFAEDTLGIEGFADKFYDYLSRGWFSLSSPIISNYGTRRGLSISCYGSHIPDSMAGILGTMAEVGMMSKHGGGTSAYFGDIRGRGEPIQPTEDNPEGENGQSEGAVNFMGMFDSLINMVKQGGVRRGAFAAYLPIDHKDILEFLEIKKEGNPIQDLFHGVTVTDEWMRAMIAGDTEKRNIWAKVIESRHEIGLPYIFFTDNANNGKPQIYKDLNMPIRGSNLCVAPETKILTEEHGYVEIRDVVGKSVHVWNGEEFSPTVPRVTSAEPVELLRVHFNSATALDCTPEHEFYTQVGYGTAPVKVKAADLQPGDKLIKFDLPVIESGTREDKRAYASGFFTGDGCHYQGNNIIYLYNDKRELLTQLDVEHTAKYVNDERIALQRCNVWDKYTVPDISYTVQTRLDWLAGLADADGTVARNGTNQALQISSTNQEFLFETQLMLQTLGVNAKVTQGKEASVELMPDGKGGSAYYDTQAVYRLLISSSGLYTLALLGFKTHRLEWELREPQRNAEQFILVTEVERTGRKDITMCFTESKRHMGMFNGVLTGQCTEIMLPNSEDESFVCNLSSMNLLHFDEWKDTDAVQVLTYFLDAVMTEFIEETEHIPFYERAHRFAKRHRAIGIGVLGWHSLLQSKMIPLESYQATRINNEIFRHIQTETQAATRQLAIDYGEPELLIGTGLRNTTTMAIAPTTSSAFILGQVSQSIEPMRSNYFVKDLAKIRTTYRNPYLKALLVEKGEDTVETWDSILAYDGSVQHLDFLTQDEKNVFKTFGEISQLELIQQAAQRQKYIDQGQSLNLMIHPDAPAKDINQLYITAWELGIKSLYYSHSYNAAQELNRDLLNVCVSCEA